MLFELFDRVIAVCRFVEGDSSQSEDVGDQVASDGIVIGDERALTRNRRLRRLRRAGHRHRRRVDFRRFLRSACSRLFEIDPGERIDHLSSAAVTPLRLLLQSASNDFHERGRNFRGNRCQLGRFLHDDVHHRFGDRLSFEWTLACERLIEDDAE